MKFPIKLLCAVLALIIGVVGLIVVLNPSQTEAEKVLDKYVSAVNKADAKTMNKLEDPTKVAKAFGALGELLDEDSIPDHDFDKGDRNEALKQSKISGFDIPEGATVEKVKLIGITEQEKRTELSFKYVSVSALIEVTYALEDGTTETVQNENSFDILYYKSAYVIIG